MRDVMRNIYSASLTSILSSDMLHPGLTRETRRDHVGGKALAAKDNDEEGKGDQNVAEERATA